jgi:serine protease AprX
MITDNAPSRRTRRRPAFLTMLALALPAFLGTSPSACQAETLSGKADSLLVSEMTAAAPSGWSSVILRLDGAMTPEHQAQLQVLGADVYRHLPIIQSVAVRVPTRNLSRLAGLTFVKHLSADANVKKNDVFTVASSYAGTAYQQYGLTGSGVTVAVLDSGIASQSDLNVSNSTTSRIVANVSFATDSTNPADLCGHGTHVAGIIAGNGASSTGSQYTVTFFGIARQAKLANVRVLDGQGQGTVSTVVAGLQWVLANKSTYNIRVINLSLGHPVADTYVNDPLCQAVEQAWKAGIVVVCAAGNDGRLNSATTVGADNSGWGTAYGSIESPGNDPYVITVGATKAENSNRANDQIATYSSRGPTRMDLVLKPDIIAPGNRVISLNSTGSYLATNDSANLEPMSAYSHSTGTSQTYYQLSGTSMATPVVSGAVAMMLQSNSSLSPDTIKARLMISATKWGYSSTSMDPCTFGAGYLNISAALVCPFTTTQYAMSPSMSQDSSGNVYINEDSSIWGTRAIWGTGITDLRAIWGTNSLVANSANVLNNSRAIWGTSVWTNRAIWGTSNASADMSSVVINGEN